MFGPDTARAETPTRSGAGAYMAGLKADLGITEDEAGAWAGFAEALWANRRRMQAVDAGDHPFGAEDDRRAALEVMRGAARPLFARLSVSQQQSARKLLPLCCQPGIDLMAS